MKFITAFVIATALLSCDKPNKYQAQLNTTDTLLRAFYNNDTLKIADLIGVNPERFGEDIEHFEFKVRGTIRLIQKNGIPDQRAYTIKEYPKESGDLIDVIVPLRKVNSKENSSKIIVRFVTFLPSSKIAFFQVDTQFDGDTKSTIEPK